MSKIGQFIKNVANLPGIIISFGADLALGNSQVVLKKKSRWYDIVRHKGLLNVFVASLDKFIHTINHGKISKWSETIRHALEYYAQKISGYMRRRKANISIIFYLSLLAAILTVPYTLFIVPLIPIPNLFLMILGSLTAVAIVTSVINFGQVIFDGVILDLFLTTYLQPKLNLTTQKKLDPLGILFDYGVEHSKKTVDTEIQNANMIDLLFSSGPLFKEAKIDSSNDDNNNNEETFDNKNFN